METAVTPPPAETKMSPGQHLGLSAYWFAYQLHWAALTVVIGNQAERMAPLLSSGLSKAEITGWVIGSGAVIAAVVPPIAGAISDRSLSRMGRRRPFVIAGTAVNVLGLYLMWLPVALFTAARGLLTAVNVLGLYLMWLAAFTWVTLAGYVAAFLVLQLGNNIALGAYCGVIPDVVPEKQRGTASGYMAAMTMVGIITGMLVPGLLLTPGKERDLLCSTLIAAALTALAVITIVSVREIPQSSARPLSFRKVLGGFWVNPRRHPDFAWVWITRFLFTSGWWMIQPNLQFFLGDVVRVENPPQMLSILGAVVLVGAMVTGLLGGILSDRLGRKRIVFLAGTLMGAAALVFGAVTVTGHASLGAIFGIAVFWGLGYGAFTSVDWALGTDVLPDMADAGKGMGVWHLSMVVPQAFAPALAGVILASYPAGGGAYLPLGYTWTFVVAGTLLLLSASLIWRVRRGR